MKTQLNWINEFIETQKQEKRTLAVNKLYLKEHSLHENFTVASSNFKELDSFRSIVEKGFKDVEKDFSYILNLINSIELTNKVFSNDISHIMKRCNGLSSNFGRLRKKVESDKK